MFDIGFSEILVIAVVALVVIGPERLPKTARTLGLLFGRLQRYVNDVKADIHREMELDELRGLQREVQGAAREFEQSVRTAASDATAGLRRVEHELNSAGSAEASAGSAEASAASAEASAASAEARASAALNAAPQASPPVSAESPPTRAESLPSAADSESAPRQVPLPGFDKI